MRERLTGAPIIQLCQMTALRASSRCTMRAHSPPGTHPPWRSRPSWSRKGNPSLGVGETAQGPTVAAIGNAICDALGVWVRTLPFTADQIAASIGEAGLGQRLHPQRSLRWCGIFASLGSYYWLSNERPAAARSASISPVSGRAADDAHAT